jgi:thioredoxin reductase (NADPH)
VLAATGVVDDAPSMDPQTHAEALAAPGVRRLPSPATDFRIEADGLSFTFPEGRRTFDSVHPAMGSTVRSDLIRALGAKTSSDGCILTDSHQRTSIRGLDAAGDVVIGLDQISHAMGQAGVAAATLRNDLAARSPLLR